MRTTEFKDTELGPIPKDWEVKRLGEVATRIGVGLATSVTQYYRDEGTVLFRNLNIKPGRLDDQDVLYLDNVFAKSQLGKLIHAGDVLSVHTGYVGISCVVPKKYEGALTFTTLITTPNRDDLLSEYMVVYMNSDVGVSEVESLQSSGGRSNLNVAEFERLRILLPPLPEQRRIAKALGDVDKLIENLKKRIEKKRNIKRGAMQELLTGKRRLKGFTGEWVERRLGDCGEWIGGGTPSTQNTEYWNGRIPWISSSDLKEGNIYHVNKTRFISESAVRNSATSKCPQGALLIIARVGVGKVAIADTELCTSQDFSNLMVDDKMDVRFLAYLLSVVMARMKEATQGTSIKGVSLEDLKALVMIRPPTLSEQRAIAKVLSDMDGEIANLEAKLKKMLLLKQGMMQDLLTGKVRLV